MSLFEENSSEKYVRKRKRTPVSQINHKVEELLANSTPKPSKTGQTSAVKQTSPIRHPSIVEDTNDEARNELHDHESKEHEDSPGKSSSYNEYSVVDLEEEDYAETKGVRRITCFNIFSGNQSKKWLKKEVTSTFSCLLILARYLF